MNVFTERVDELNFNFNAIKKMQWEASSLAVYVHTGVDRADDCWLEKYLPEAERDAERDEHLSSCDGADASYPAGLHSRQLHAGSIHTWRQF